MGSWPSCSLQGLEYSYEGYRAVTLGVSKQEIAVHMKSSSSSTLMQKIRILFNFNQATSNETVLVVYGSHGLQIYNWSLELLKQIHPQRGEIVSVHLEPTLLFYLTSAGALFVYDLASLKNEQICLINEHRATRQAEMHVFPEPKTPTKRSTSICYCRRLAVL